MSLPPVLLDACVLVPASLSDLLLRLAEDPLALYRPRWSAQILSEVQRNQEKLGWPQAIADSWRVAVDSAFPAATITGYEPHLAHCTNHAGDRHVLAAAIRGSCQTVVTFNIKHFTEVALEPYGIKAVAPDNFLSDLALQYPQSVKRKFREAALARNREVNQNIDH